MEGPSKIKWKKLAQKAKNKAAKKKAGPLAAAAPGGKCGAKGSNPAPTATAAAGATPDAAAPLKPPAPNN
jgi:hypothetical protein